MLWLYDEFETDFTYNGIVLNNAYDSDIHWVLNTMYKLTFKYPTVDNDLYSFIEKGMIVKADEHDRTNLFRIKDIDISENDKCITVTAYQKNYDFSKRLVNNFGRLRVNCMSVLDEWYSNFLSSEKDFSYYSDINAINSFVSHNDDTDNKLRTSFELLGGIADTYSADIDMHDKQISLLERLGRDTEEVLTTAKNISEFVNTSNSDEIVTRIYASSTFKVGDKYDKKDLREQHREQLKALRESQKEYSQGRNAIKKAQQMKDEIAKKYAKELAKNNKKVKRSGKVIKSYSQIESEVNAKYQERERKSQQRKAESQAIADRRKAEIESLKAQQKEELDALDEEITINLIVESPLINDYPFINEIAVSNNDLRTAEELEEWAMEYFTKQNIDKPKNSIKVTYEQLSEDINRGDTVILKYLKYGVDERIRVVETHYDPMLKKWKEFILGEKEGRLGSEVSNASSGAIAKANAYTDIITMDIERKVKERSENYDKLFKKNTDVINKKIEDGFEKAKASSEVTIAKIDEGLEKKLAPIRNQVSTTVENYNRQFQATNLEISKNRVEATKQIQALTDRVNNIQDISNNETVVELRGLVNGATSKVTELENSITREFTEVKKKNEDSLNAVKAEFKKGVDGLTSKITSLEEFKNQDGSRTETLKQWVQKDTASQLNRERTEINKIIDNKGFVKNTEFSSKFTESARGITNQLSALETYKNQDGTRVANMQIWVQNNTANQLTAERRNIEKWVNDKGYATNSVVENKVRETANSFSRDLSNATNSINTLNSWKQTATETLNTVSSGLNDAVKHSQLRVGADKIDFGSNKVFDGRNLASMLSVSPESIQAISDRVIITPSNENLVDVQFRESATSSVRDVYLTPEISSDKLNNGDQFIVEGIGTWSGTLRHDLNFIIAVKYKSGRWTWITSRLKARGEYSNSIIPLKTTLTINGLNEEVAMYRLGLQQPDWSNFTNITFKNAKIYKKKSAELIVDGSIEGRQIKTETLETGHHKAGSITSDIIAANAVKAKHVEIDDGLINNLVSHKAFITKLWAQDAFIKSLQTVKIKSTQLDTDFLSSYTGEIGGFRIGRNPNDSSSRWLTGQNNFRIGMSPGDMNYNELSTALWVAWSDKWDTPGDRAWWVTNAGVMHSKRTPIFYNGLNVPGGVIHYSNGTYTYSPNIKHFVYESNSKGEKWVRFHVGSNGKDHRTYSQYWVIVTQSGSDKRYKSNIKPTEVNGLEIINNLKCYDYNIKLPTDKESKHIKCGIMAQDVKEYMEDAYLVNPDEVQSYKPFEMIPYLIKAVQELSEENKILKQQIGGINKWITNYNQSI
jgi:phage minor structural protein, N-terminal domain protein|nr:MAG TPA: tail protein [Caudoviricetes sp.]